MDKRYLLAFFLTFLILIFYPKYLKMISPTYSDINGYDKINPVAEPVPIPEPALPSPPLSKTETLSFQKGPYEVLFSTRGGSLLLLKLGENVFYDAGERQTGIFTTRLLNETEDLSGEAFAAKLEDEEKAKVPQFSYEKSGEYRLVKKFYFGGDHSTILLELKLENLSGKTRNFTLETEYALNTPTHNSHDQASIQMVRLSGEQILAAKWDALKKIPSQTAEPLEWHGLLRKYDALLVKPEAKIVGQETRVEEKGQRLVSRLKLSPITVPPQESRNTHLMIYAGPQKYETLKNFGFGFEKILTRGVFGTIHLWILLGLNYFYGLTKNYGVAILLLTLLIKLLFTPLTHMSYASMSKMQALQPKMKAIQNQYKNDPQRMNKEVMGLYKRNRVNPLGGCLPMLLQIPIFFAFYQVLSETSDLKGAPFIGWIRDLSAPDQLFVWPTPFPFVGNAFNLLPILMIGSMLWQQKLTPQTATSPGQEKMMYLMPVVFGFIFYGLPSGLVLYWFFNNLLTIFHQLFIKRIPIILHHEDR